VVMPRLRDATTAAGDVHLAESFEERLVRTQHLHEKAAVVRHNRERLELDAVDHLITRVHATRLRAHIDELRTRVRKYERTRQSPGSIRPVHSYPRTFVPSYLRTPFVHCYSASRNPHSAFSPVYS